MYHCYFTYFETETESQPRVNTTKSWNYPNLKAIMKDLNNRWIKEKVPLTIKEHPSGRVMISHNMPGSMGSLASLKLSPNLAFMLGYTSDVIKHGQFLRFDENKEFLAPHKPKLFMGVVGEMEAENSALKQEFTGKLAKIENEHKQKKIEIENKWKSYALRKIASLKDKLTLECFTKLNVQKENLEMANGKCNEKIKQLNQKLKDYSDRVDNGIVPIKDFDKFKSELWVIKGVVSDKQWIDQKEFNITFKDYSGTITIKGYDHQGGLLDALSVKGKEYYISNINNKAHQSQKSMFTVHDVYIGNYFFKVMFNDVN